MDKSVDPFEWLFTLPQNPILPTDNTDIADIKDFWNEIKEFSVPISPQMSENSSTLSSPNKKAQSILIAQNSEQLLNVLSQKVTAPVIMTWLLEEIIRITRCPFLPNLPEVASALSHLSFHPAMHQWIGCREVISALISQLTMVLSGDLISSKSLPSSFHKDHSSMPSTLDSSGAIIPHTNSNKGTDSPLFCMESDATSKEMHEAKRAHVSQKEETRGIRSDSVNSESTQSRKREEASIDVVTDEFTRRVYAVIIRRECLIALYNLSATPGLQNLVIECHAVPTLTSLISSLISQHWIGASAKRDAASLMLSVSLLSNIVSESRSLRDAVVQAGGSSASLLSAIVSLVFFLGNKSGEGSFGRTASLSVKATCAGLLCRLTEVGQNHGHLIASDVVHALGTLMTSELSAWKQLSPFMKPTILQKEEANIDPNHSNTQTVFDPLHSSRLRSKSKEPKSARLILSKTEAACVERLKELVFQETELSLDEETVVVHLIMRLILRTLANLSWSLRPTSRAINTQSTGLREATTSNIGNENMNDSGAKSRSNTISDTIIDIGALLAETPIFSSLLEFACSMPKQESAIKVDCSIVLCNLSLNPDLLCAIIDQPLCLDALTSLLEPQIDQRVDENSMSPINPTEGCNGTQNAMESSQLAIDCELQRCIGLIFANVFAPPKNNSRMLALGKKFLGQIIVHPAKLTPFQILVRSPDPIVRQLCSRILVGISHYANNAKCLKSILESGFLSILAEFLQYIDISVQRNAKSAEKAPSRNANAFAFESTSVAVTVDQPQDGPQKQNIESYLLARQSISPMTDPDSDTGGVCVSVASIEDMASTSKRQLELAVNVSSTFYNLICNAMNANLKLGVKPKDLLPTSKISESKSSPPMHWSKSEKTRSSSKRLETSNAADLFKSPTPSNSPLPRHGSKRVAHRQSTKKLIASPEEENQTEVKPNDPLDEISHEHAAEACRPSSPIPQFHQEDSKSTPDSVALLLEHNILVTMYDFISKITNDPPKRTGHSSKSLEYDQNSKDQSYFSGSSISPFRSAQKCDVLADFAVGVVLLSMYPSLLGFENEQSVLTRDKKSNSEDEMETINKKLHTLVVAQNAADIMVRIAGMTIAIN